MSTGREVNGIEARSQSEYDAFLRDNDKIQKIKKRFNLKNVEDIEKIHGSIVNGSLEFESKVGFEFEDEIDDLYRKFHLNTPRKVPKKYEDDFRVEESTDYADKELVEYYLKKRQRNSVIFKYLIIGLSCIVIIGCSVFALRKIGSDLNSDESMESISVSKKDNAFVFTTIKPDYNTTVTYDEFTIPDVLSEYASLVETNNDLVGWIHIDDTYIDYPVMQAKDNDYYLSHNFDGKKDANGCIFADANCSIYPRSKNIILYGHHMKSGKMFAHLEKYNEYEFYVNHKTFIFDTIYEHSQYEIVCVFRDYVHTSDDTDFKYYEFVNVNSETEFDSYVSEMKEKALYETGVTAEYNDDILMLSTCDYAQKNGRFVVMAKKIK